MQQWRYKKKSGEKTKMPVNSWKDKQITPKEKNSNKITMFHLRLNLKEKTHMNQYNSKSEPQEKKKNYKKNKR